MSVNNIDFTLGSYNPNQAAGLIAMARENDRQISDSLKGILDGFEKTARENADVQAMNYINSLGLQDMTPDKMAGHTQALGQIADSMGGLNPSKEALTALDGRGNVLTQRENNNLTLEAQKIANTSSRFDMEKKGDDRVLNMAIDSAIANPSMMEQIKSTLPLHLQAMFGDKVYQRREEHNKEINALNSAINGQKADSAWNTISAFSPKFASSDGTIDYDKMFNDAGVNAALGDTMQNPEVIGLLVQKMNKEAAEKLEAAHKMKMNEIKANVAQQTANVAQMRAENDIEFRNRQFEYGKQQDELGRQETRTQQEQKAAKEVNDNYQKVLEGTVFKGSVSKNVDGSLNLNPEKLASSVTNRLNAVAQPVEIKYKAASVDAWWTENEKFGVSNLTFIVPLGQQTGVRDYIKTEFGRFKDPHTGKQLSKDTQIAMLEKLKASIDRSTNFGVTTTQDAFGKTAYYRNGKLDMNALHSAVINDRNTEAQERVRKESFKIMQDASNLGIDLGLLNKYLPSDFASKYSMADPSFRSKILFPSHNSDATAPLNKGSGGYNNNALKYFGTNKMQSAIFK